jgi:hypothetical protein
MPTIWTMKSPSANRPAFHIDAKVDERFEA